ncbi:zinc-dependent alcohol dehydrogenase [Phytohabitans rumicis]|uniref:Dehydrogenase n=1 Tax=Phytohabitans rumicis TaxID=1076125 RepID=A0A6V8KNR5_9ACTN|nr:alcohol dehydrogenase catalytic domain-containing protein [Phytohabitans rumicis]GFJ86803.1 dehydrogenase [Phytohabitans rumicis]
MLVRVAATGICGSDLHGYTGENGRRHPGQVMGHETVGRIEGSGALVTVNPVIGCGICAQCAAGTEQLCAGRRIIGVDPTYRSAFAELMAVPAGNVVVLPVDTPIEYGALVEPLSVGYHAAVRGGVSPDDRVLVIGGGPIGQACALAARRLGAAVVVVSEPTASRRALVSRLGFEAVEPADLADLGDMATVVLDAVGSSASLAAAFAGSALGARVVLVGMNAPEVSVAAYAVSTYERSVIGSFCYPAREFRETAAWVATRPPGLEHLVDGRAGLGGAPDAFAGLASGALDASKILVYCGEA